MSEKKYSGKVVAKTLASLSLDTQVLCGTMKGTGWQGTVGDDQELQRETGVELGKLLKAQVKDQISQGDMTPLLEMLNGQAFALNRVFMDLVSSSSPHTLEFAFKAQNQCRRVLGTMAQIAAPKASTVIHGNNVQVNTGKPSEGAPIREIKKA